MQALKTEGFYKGRRYYRIPVRVRLNDSRSCRTVAEVIQFILAPSATEAANHVREIFASRPETEIRAWGPKGGEVDRFIGWESAIGHELLTQPRGVQGVLFA